MNLAINTDLYGVTAMIFLGFWAQFFLLAGTAWLVFWAWGAERFAHRRIQHWSRPARPWRELYYSTLSIAIISGLLGLTLQLADWGLTRMYFELTPADAWYIPLTVLVMVLVHDTYYYWAHRLMHHPKVYSRVHALHHSFSNPTPFASYAFHPLEAVIEVAWFLPLALLLPIHPLAVASYVVVLTALNVVSHLGYEFYPARLARWFITSTHHNLHHDRSHGHFMLYFNFWDRLMDTNERDYEMQIALINERPRRVSRLVPARA